MCTGCIQHDAHHTIRSSMKMKLAPVHELLGDTAFLAFYTIRHVFSLEVVWFTVHVQQNYKSIYIRTEVYILY